MRRSIFWLALALIGATLVAASGAAGDKGKHHRDLSAFNSYSVRFVPGTSLQQMTRAIQKAGGTVVADMHDIGAMEASSLDPAFATKLNATPLVTTSFLDSRGPADSAPDASQLGGKSVGGGKAKGGNGGGTGFDPWHDQYQWDDQAMDVPSPSARTSGSGVKVAVIDTGVDPNQRDVGPNDAGQTNSIPCDALASVVGKAQVRKFLGLSDCNNQDNMGHGTFIAGRIAGALNGFASNGIAPSATILDEKAAAEDYGFDTAWVIAAMLDACDKGADVLNMSLNEYDDPTDPGDSQIFLLWVDAVNYCRAKGVTIVAAGGNDHVRVDRVDLNVGGRDLHGVGLVDSGNDGIGLPVAGLPLTPADERGMLLAPGGVPGVIMVSATGNTVADSTGAVDPAFAVPAGLQDQLAYYSSYGSRTDIAAPGGARSFDVPSYDASSGDDFDNGNGIFSTTDPSASLCDPSVGSACFKNKGDGFMWLQGTSMATAEVSGAVAALLSAHPELRHNPDAVLARLQATARTNMTNAVGPMSPSTAPTLIAPCDSGFCHLDTADPISFADAYGAGIVDVGRATQ
jgi:subtilisin family serine protease